MVVIQSGKHLVNAQLHVGEVFTKGQEWTDLAPDNRVQNCGRLGPAMESEQFNAEPSPSKAGFGFAAFNTRNASPFLT